MSSLPVGYSKPASPATWRLILEKLGPLLGLSFVFAFFAILVPLHTGRNTFVTLGNAELILRQTAIIGIAAVGMTVIIISGGIDLSAGPVIALTTVVVALLLQRGHSASSSAIGGVAAAAGCGLITSQIITRLKIPPFIATLGM